MMSADIERPKWIVMEWMDEEGVTHKEKFDGFLARLYQHEEDHLKGIINLDRACNSIEFALFDPLKEKIRDTRY